MSGDRPGIPGERAGSLTARSELLLVVGLSLLGLVLVLVALQRPWFTYHEELGAGLPSAAHTVKGHRLSNGTLGAVLVAPAALAALLAVPRAVRRIFGMIILLGGVFAAVNAVLVLVDGIPDRVRTLGLCRSATACGSPASSEAWVVVLALGGLLLAGAGWLAVLHAHTWQGLGRSYEAPGGRPAEPVTDKGVWDALDRGDDPTA